MNTGVCRINWNCSFQSTRSETGSRINQPKSSIHFIQYQKVSAVAEEASLFWASLELPEEQQQEPEQLQQDCKKVRLLSTQCHVPLLKAFQYGTFSLFQPTA